MQLSKMSRHTDELVYDVGSLFWRCLAQDHGLDPLGEAIEQVDGSLHRRIIVDDALDGIGLVVAEVDSSQGLPFKVG